jgi:hypothetical protein
MRYYDIFIADAPPSFVPNPRGSTWSSHPWGGTKRDPSAQQVELSLWTSPIHSPSGAGQSTAEIYGVSWEQIGQQSKLIGKAVTIYGGMHPGFPLANIQARPGLPGLLMQGRITQSWGNWLGTQMSVGFVISPAGDTSGADSTSPTTPSPAGGGEAPAAPAAQAQMTRTGPRSIDRKPFAIAPPTVSQRGIGGDFTDFASIGQSFGNATSTFGGIVNSFFGGGGGLISPLNFIHNLMPNMPLSGAIQETISKVFPNAKTDIRISDALKLAYQDAGMYQNLEQYAQFIKQLSQSILGSTGYKGVMTVPYANTLRVFDGTKQPYAYNQITAEDLIGQPTWVGVAKVNIISVMRSDIVPGNMITLPSNILMAVSQGANVAGNTQRTNLSFTGQLSVESVHHVGDFRNPDGAQWVTVIVANDPMQGPQVTNPPVNVEPVPSTILPLASQFAGGIIPMSAPSSRLMSRSARGY